MTEGETDKRSDSELGQPSLDEDRKQPPLRIIIPNKTYRKLIQGPDQVFLSCLQIARTVNALEFAMRCYLRTGETDRFEAKKDRIEAILLLAARLSEATKTYKKYRNVICNTAHYQKKLNEFRELAREDDFQRLLRDIRNKVLFHFDPDVLTAVMNQFADKDPVMFGGGESETNKDLVYSMPDDFVVTYVAGRMGGAADETAWEGFLCELLVRSKRFLSLMNVVLGELLIERCDVYAVWAPIFDSRNSGRNSPGNPGRSEKGAVE